MCGEEKKEEEREKARERFREDLHQFLERYHAEVHMEDISEGLIYEATTAACFWFGCYLHMLGFLTSELHNGLEEKFEDVRKLVNEARKGKDAPDSV
jgi:hypothetical protein